MRHQRKKLLVAAIGVAAMNYACQEKPPIQTGNLMAPVVTPDAGAVTPPENKPDAEPMIMSGNLMAPPPPPPTSTPTLGPDHKLRTGNLMPPPPPPPPTQGTAKPVPVPKK